MLPTIPAPPGIHRRSSPSKALGAAFPPWKAPRQNPDELGLHLPEGADRTGFVHSNSILGNPTALQTHFLLENFLESPPVAGAWVGSSLHVLKIKHGWNPNVCLIWDFFGIAPQQGTFYIPNPPSAFGKLAATKYPAIILGFEMLIRI